MPLKLVPPRPGKSPNFTIRGAYLGIKVDKSCGTPKRSVAGKVLQRLERAIEAGEYPESAAPRNNAEPTFLTAAVGYLEAGRSQRYVGRLIKHFGETALKDMNQDLIDEAAIALCPGTTPANRNRQVYIPTSAILRHAKVMIKIDRPKGARGRTIVDALNPDDAFAIIRCAASFDLEFSVLLTFLLYTGCRLGEALALEWDRVRLTEARAWVRTSKNGDPREVQLRADLTVAMTKLADGRTSGRVFRFHQGGHLKHQLLRAKLGALGMSCPVRRPTDPKKKWRPPPYRLSWANFHSFCHTWATWMRRYGGADVQGLVETKRWRDPKSAARYTHVVARDEWNRVERLPALGGKNVESA